MAVHIPSVPATFIHIPKTAGSAFSRWIEEYIPGVENRSKHCTLQKAATIWKDLGTTFTFVRNPWDRMVSYWSFIGQRAQQRLIDRANGAKVKRNITAEKDFELCSYYQKGFDTWICDIYYQRPNAFDLDDAHHQRQTPQMYWTQGVDLIIRVEDFDRDFLKIQSLVGCYQPLQKRNTSDHGHYRQYYQSNTQQMVAEMFNQDIKKFDYEF